MAGRLSYSWRNFYGGKRRVFYALTLFFKNRKRLQTSQDPMQRAMTHKRQWLDCLNAHYLNKEKG
jgi:hypothetical protein